MAAPESDNQERYIFKRDYRSIARLNYNHYLHIHLLGYILHPSIPTSSPSLRVADIGTGTALVPIELSTYLPSSSRIDGFDISTAQFPPQAWLPPNVQLYERDVFEEFPGEFRGVYDVVHVRYFSTLVKSHDLGRVVGNLMGLLKPGGFIQWSEPDMTSLSAISISPSTTKEAAQQLAQMAKQPGPDVELGWVPNLSSKLSDEGLEVIADDRIPVPDRYRMLFNVSHLLTLEDVILANAPETAMFSRGSEMLEKLQTELMQNGVSLDENFVVVVARRKAT